MKATTGQKVRTGIFSIAALFLLVGAIFLIGKTKNMFGDTFHIYANFKNVGGLQVGNNVRFVGVNVGTVEGIQIISDTLARVDMVLESEVNPYVRRNAIATIGSDGLMGDKLINVAATDENSQLMKNGDRIATTEPIDLSKTMERIDNIAENAEVITFALAGITTRINDGKGSLGRLLNSDELAKDLEGTAQSMKEGTQGFSENMKALKGNVLLRGYYKRKEKEERREERKEKREEKQNKNK